MSIRPLLPVVRHYANPLQAFLRLRQDYPQWWHASSPAEANPHPWPAGMEPGRSRVFAHNEVAVPQSPREVFDALVQARTWPSYYPNADHVRLPEGKDALEPGLRFTWSTFGTRQQTTVREFVPGKVLAWEADSPGTRAYHRWILQEHEGGTRVITEETQNGPVAWLDHGLMNPGLHAAHQRWLEGLKAHLADGQR